MRFIKNSVGNNMVNEPDDVKLVSGLMQQIGNVEGYENQSGQSGYITRELDNAIKIFQQDNNLKIDGILRPRGETETMLQHVLKGNVRTPDFAPTQTAQYKPRNEIGFGGNVLGILNPDQVTRKPVQTEEKTQTPQAPETPPVPQSKPKQDKQLDVDIQKDKTENVYDGPAEKKDWFNSNEKRRQSWIDHAKAVKEDKESSDLFKTISKDLFAFEGGAADNDGTTVAGITQGALKGLENEDFYKEYVKKHGKKDIKPSDLDMEDIINFHKGYFDRYFRGAAETMTKETSKKINGHQMLDTIGDDNIARAVADALFRIGSTKGAKIIYDSTIAVLPNAENRINDDTIGTKAFADLRRIAQNAELKRQFLDKLKEGRDEAYPDEQPRNSYFRFLE